MCATISEDGAADGIKELWNSCSVEDIIFDNFESKFRPRAIAGVGVCLADRHPSGSGGAII
eukprot:613782-Pyramimonas_sp.AAC.2